MHKPTLKDRIIETAGTLFHQKGYNLTGIDEVIEKADIARGSLYYHFESKSELLLAWLETYHHKWYAGLETYLRSVTDPKKKILAIFDYRIRNQEKVGFVGCPFIKINDEVDRTDQRIIQFVQSAKKRLRAYLGDLVAQSGHRKILSDEELVDALYFLLEGGITSSAVFKNSAELKKARKVAAKLL
jgi:AcrR family transcriptional regulator